MFSEDAKDEIAAVRFERACCPAHFVRALAAFSSRSTTGRTRSFAFRARPAIARAALRAGKAAGISIEAAPTDHRLTRGAVRLFGDAPFAIAPHVPARACCRRAWLRGAFLACGSVADPRRGYHLEFYCRDDDDARALSEGLGGVGVDAGVTRRRSRPLVYIKGAPAVADLLGQMGAARAVLALDDLLAMRHTKNVTRRRVNSEAANAARAAVTSARQREAALRVLNRRGVSGALCEAARLRIAHPDYTLAELAASARPRVTKAAMAYRLREMERLAS